jgi:hypothetical protein
MVTGLCRRYAADTTMRGGVVQAVERPMSTVTPSFLSYP